MKYFLSRNVKEPARGTDKSAGIDFFVPAFNNDNFIIDLEEKNKNICIMNDKILLKPGERVLIPSGVYVKIPEDYCLIAFNKSGVASKKGLDVLSCLVDADYMGEIHLSLVNTSDENVYIYENEKIIQFVLVPTIYNTPIKVESKDELYKNLKSNRGEGGFGSTGN
ncbi:MAG TPA: hypothetical protein PLY35_08355 [Thermotogota bacterium]|nr:hypothetical protein [Thermotogota bacterium]